MYDQIATLAGLPGNDHAQAGETLFMAGLCWSRFVDADRFPVNCAYNTLPARQGFLQTQLDCCDKVIALTDEVWMWCLVSLLAMLSYQPPREMFTYLLHDQMHVLATTLFLVSDISILDLRAGTQTGFDVGFQCHLLYTALPTGIKRLALRLHLLRGTVEDLLQGQLQILFDDSRFRRRGPRLCSVSSRARTATEATTTHAAAQTAAKHRENIIIKATHTASAGLGEVAENVFCIAEAETASAAGAGREVECSRSAAAGHAAEVEASRHSTRACTTACAAARRRCRAAAHEVVKAELIVDLALFGVRENFVCL